MKYIEVLTDGFTVGGQVRRAGDVVAIEDDRYQSKKDQVERWGTPRYKSISESEFTERGGAVRSVPAQSQPVPAGDPFADLEGENVEDTLAEASTFDDAKLAQFIEWERAHGNRKGVLEPLGAEG